METRVVVSLVSGPTMLALVGKIKSSYERQVALIFRGALVSAPLHQCYRASHALDWRQIILSSINMA